VQGARSQSEGAPGRVPFAHASFWLLAARNNPRAGSGLASCSHQRLGGHATRGRPQPIASSQRPVAHHGRRRAGSKTARCKGVRLQAPAKRETPHDAAMSRERRRRANPLAARRSQTMGGRSAPHPDHDAHHPGVQLNAEPTNPCLPTYPCRIRITWYTQL
jgi:hypothetical protein